VRTAGGHVALLLRLLRLRRGRRRRLAEDAEDGWEQGFVRAREEPVAGRGQLARRRRHGLQAHAGGPGRGEDAPIADALSRSWAGGAMGKHARGAGIA